MQLILMKFDDDQLDLKSIMNPSRDPWTQSREELSFLSSGCVATVVDETDGRVMRNG